jgi:FKBP-type peptidyl-prolyl cis-trans isomerase FklB
MMKKILYLLVFTVININIYAQSPKNQIDSISYLIGQSIATNLLKDLSEANKEMVIQGLSDQLYNRKALCSDPGNTTLNRYFQEKNRIKAQETEKEGLINKAKGELFLAENKKNENVLTTASGLQYIVLEQGSGSKPTATSKVKVHYHGTIPTGEVFDSSVDRGDPITFGLNQVIKGWTEGLQLMPVGSKFKFFIPQELAYGANSQPGSIIEPYMPLVFEVELLEIISE